MITQTINGIWKGTSLYQIQNAPCPFGIVVDHISKDNPGKSYDVVADKIVDGKEEHRLL